MDETLKALADMWAWGTGAVLIEADGTVKHVLFEELQVLGLTSTNVVVDETANSPISSTSMP